MASDEQPEDQTNGAAHRKSPVEPYSGRGHL